MWLGLVGMAALAQSDVEVVVYDDLFARWHDTRWVVEAELVTPLGTWLADDDNRGLTSYAFQVQSVLACRKDAKLSKKKLEVSCTIEDFALRASTYRHWGSAHSQEQAEGVLDRIDALITGAEVQLQVDAKGGINNVDIEGLPASNERERVAREGLRQVVMRVISGYHLRIPDQGQRPGQVLEHNSELMAVPSLMGTQGSTVLVHSVAPWRQYNLVQTMGEGTVTATVPAPRKDVPHELRSPDDPEYEILGLSKGDGKRTTLLEDLQSPSTNDPLAEVPSGLGAFHRRHQRTSRPVPTAPPPTDEDMFAPLPRVENSDGDVLETPMAFSLTSSGVALFERATGVLTERVWVVDGEPLAASGDGVRSAPFRNVGSLRILRPDEHPDLGPTEQVAPPGLRVDGLPDWSTLERVLDTVR